MSIQKVFSWLIAAVALITLSLGILVGDLIKKDIVSPRKPEPMKEQKMPCQPKECHSLVKDGKNYKICITYCDTE